MKRPNPYIDLPLTVGRVLAMLLSVVVYVSQLVYGSLLGFCWFTCGRKTDEKRERYHRAIWRFFNFDLRYHPWLYADILNPYGETFNRGAILICNHQSLLDTLCLLILSPRILLVTHDRVWNNPLVVAVPFWKKVIPLSSFPKDSVHQTAISNASTRVLFTWQSNFGPTCCRCSYMERPMYNLRA